MQQKILVVEDEIHIIELLKYNIEMAGYQLIYTENGKDGIDVCIEQHPDLVILDLMLPDIDGFEVCKILKRDDRTKNIPVIILTAKGEEFDKVLGLELGADDYITKPFSVRELMARIKAVLRRFKVDEKSEQKDDDQPIVVRDITILPDKFQVFKNGIPIELTLKEFELLKLLAENKDKVLARNLLLDKIWGYEYVGETRTVDVHIRHLRKKLGDENVYPPYIETVRGIGYKLNSKGE
ncbi:two-component system, OmpR family, alkaline phosphatase synthesis response regulator PhoP [Caldanaerobius fijiensis DSM 17918]|uniref:Stage 0 sporulation protein A homolog n=1 Tax=Caldanaerobius fijiensis DSM 17918 TaxID=1121256 RepID=A0A1M4T132_9THEO|nr:response regulator transcription factor [Caldanaerobius fijiensis]SHE38144.1 two-component system, OmpR family, alkaline phosphatase synthesis response regulator PhoP [Caldanaerobius fijiensis DSM 17918]